MAAVGCRPLRGVGGRRAGAPRWRRPRPAARRRPWPSSRFGRCRRRAAPVRWRHRARRRGAGSTASSACARAADADVGRRRRPGDLERVDERELADRGDVLGERCDHLTGCGARASARPPPAAARSATSGSAPRPSPRRPSAADWPSRPSGARRRRPTPGRRRRRAPARPRSRRSVPARPASPAGQSLRGSITHVDGPRGASRAAATVAADGCAPGWRQLAGAHRAAPARARVGVVERLLEELHQAAVAGRVPAHQVGLGRTHRPQRGPLRRVVHPRRARSPTSRPCSRTTTSSTARIFSSASIRPRRSRVAVSSAGTEVGTVGERGEDRVDVRRGRGCPPWRSTPRSARRRRRQEHGDRLVERAPGPADLLVVGDRRRRASRGGCRTPRSGLS